MRDSKRKLANDVATKICHEFCQGICESLQVGSSLLLTNSYHNLLAPPKKFRRLEVGCVEEIPRGSHFDLLWGNLPIGLRPKSVPHSLTNSRFKYPENWIHLFAMLQHMSEVGKGLFIVEPHCFGTIQGQRFRELLAGNGFYFDAFFRAPEDSLRNSSLRPVIATVSREGHDTTFVAELSSLDQILPIVENYTQRIDSSTLEFGTFIEIDTFAGFDQLRAFRQMERLESQYHSYEQKEIGEIARSIRSVKSGEFHAEATNAIYVPRVGNSSVVSDISNATLKHHNYHQVVLQDSTVNEYLAAFFQSKIGHLTLQAAMTVT